jgi:hypothetical protein
MKTRMNTVTTVLVVLLLVPALSWAETKDKGMMGPGMMGREQTPMMQGKETEHRDMQMMHEMMGMMHEMMGMMKGMTQDPTMKGAMEKRMERMNEMMKQHEQMMGEHQRMMKRGKE